MLIKKTESIPINRGTLDANNSGDTKGGILEKNKVSPAESPSSNGFQASGDTGDTKNTNFKASGESIKIDDLFRLDKSKKPKASKIELATVWYVTKVVGSQIHVASEFIQGERIFDTSLLVKVG